jgi:ribonuclease Z
MRTLCLMLACFFAFHESLPAQNPQIVFLGTGTPRPQTEHQGPAIAIVVDGRSYLVDAGVGVVRQASASGMAGLKMENLKIAFLTHLHADHTLGLADLILTPWIMGRKTPFELYGPKGTAAMAEHLLKAYEKDIEIRVHGLEGNDPEGWKVNTHEISAGAIFQDERVKVAAFPVKHGSWKEAYGYRFDSSGKSIVISGDAAPGKSVVDACNGCDVLVHEVYSGAGGTSQKTEEEWMKYMAEFHTSAQELGVLASQARAKTLIVTHYLALGGSNESELLRDIRKNFSGTVMIARDLDVVAP